MVVDDGVGVFVGVGVGVLVGVFVGVGVFVKVGVGVRVGVAVGGITEHLSLVHTAFGVAHLFKIHLLSRQTCSFGH